MFGSREIQNLNHFLHDLETQNFSIRHVRGVTGENDPGLHPNDAGLPKLAREEFGKLNPYLARPKKRKLRIATQHGNCMEAD